MDRYIGLDAHASSCTLAGSRASPQAREQSKWETRPPRGRHSSGFIRTPRTLRYSLPESELRSEFSAHPKV